MNKEKKIKVSLLRSSHGRPPKQSLALQGLGLKKIGASKELEDTPSVRGMINRVSHLVKVES